MNSSVDDILCEHDEPYFTKIVHVVSVYEMNFVVLPQNSKECNTHSAKNHCTTGRNRDFYKISHKL